MAVVADLLATTEVAAATDFLVSGSSAGGFGTFLNADYVAATLPPTVRVRAAPQAGYFFPPVTPFAAWAADNLGPPYAGQNSSILELWQPIGNAGCIAAHNATYCASVYAAYPYIKTPMFLVENQADSNQVRPIPVPVLLCVKVPQLMPSSPHPTLAPTCERRSLRSWARR